jgi:single-stranded-DNA-specific exonuclease
VVEPRYRWQFVPPVTPSLALIAAGQASGLSPLTVGLLAGRGLTNPAELDAFFAPPLDGLHDPGLLPDAAIAHERIARARRDGERVQVFGDFDADGLTGLAIVTIALRRLGIEVIPYVPSRLEDGHGLSMGAVAAASDADVRLIITVDTGSSSVDEIAAAASHGIDVIVTDHHRVPPTPPAALALVNPHRPGATYPDRRLSGSGVAFKLGQLLLGAEAGGPQAALDLADLATIGTVADLAPVLGENRSIARLGLERLRSEPRAGIAALLTVAGITAGSVDLDTIAFNLAPRLNAAGRVGEAGDAARLLLATGPEEAAALAATLETANLTRRDLTKQVVAEARAALAQPTLGLLDEAVDRPPASVVRGSWPVGIVGLVASRLVEETGLPAVVGADLGSVVRASCRSGPGFDLGAALETCADLFVRYGGHPGAAGFEIAADRWAEFETRFLGLAAVSAPPDPRPVLRVDLALPGRAIDYVLLRDLSRLGPTGPGHAEPLVCVSGLTVTRIRPANGGHTQLTLRRDPDVLDGIAFGREDLATALSEGDRVDVVARLASRSFGGFESIQLEVRDVARGGSQAAANAALVAAGFEVVGTTVPAPVVPDPVALGSAS